MKDRKGIGRADGGKHLEMIKSIERLAAVDALLRIKEEL